MQAHALLAALYQQGFTLTPLPEGKLEVQPASKLTPELRVALTERKAEVLTLLEPNYRALYEKGAGTIAEDCLVIDPHWLLEHHPDLWERMRRLDEALTGMEHQGAAEGAYRGTLEELVACVREARTVYIQDTPPLPQ